MDRLEGVLSPSEGAMAVDQHTRNLVFIDSFKCLNDYFPGFQFIGSRDFFTRHPAGARDCSVEVIPLRRPIGWNLYSPLRQSGCPWRMRMDHSADIFEVSVEFKMRIQIRRWFQAAFHYISVHIDDNDVFNSHISIFDPGWLDCDDLFFTVYFGNIAPGEFHQPIFRQRQVSFQHSFFQFSVCHGSTAYSPKTISRTFSSISFSDKRFFKPMIFVLL